MNSMIRKHLTLHDIGITVNKAGKAEVVRGYVRTDRLAKERLAYYHLGKVRVPIEAKAKPKYDFRKWEPRTINEETLFKHILKVLPTKPDSHHGHFTHDKQGLCVVTSPPSEEGAGLVYISVRRGKEGLWPANFNVEQQEAIIRVVRRVVVHLGGEEPPISAFWNVNKDGTLHEDNEWLACRAYVRRMPK